MSCCAVVQLTPSSLPTAFVSCRIDVQSNKRRFAPLFEVSQWSRYLPSRGLIACPVMCLSLRTSCCEVFPCIALAPHDWVAVSVAASEVVTIASSFLLVCTTHGAFPQPGVHSFLLPLQFVLTSVLMDPERLSRVPQPVSSLPPVCLASLR